MSQSHACCTVPAVVSEGYKEKGEFITVDGLKTYATGSKDAKTAIFVVYDIFGFFPQTLQGADILSTGDKEKQYQVFIPDFFDGSAADISWYPPGDDKEKGEKLGKFFKEKADFGKATARVPKLIEDIRKQRPSITTFGIVGFCWGGKVTNLVSKKDSLFKAAAVGHPAFVDAADAPDVTIPFLSIPSKDESKEDVEKWEKAITVPHKVKAYDDQVHGFMAARSDLKDPKVEAAYKDAYGEVLAWFHEHL